MLEYQAVKKAIAEGLALEMCKFKRDDEWSAWKPVSAEVAAHKAEIRVLGYVDDDIEEWECPYGFRLVNPEDEERLYPIYDFRLL
jgi:hypothetical protein